MATNEYDFLFEYFTDIEQKIAAAPSKKRTCTAKSKLIQEIANFSIFLDCGISTITHE